jgi:hypothetical protein
MSAKTLIATYGFYGQHPEVPLWDWLAAVENNETRLGYWDYVSQIVGRH